MDRGADHALSIDFPCHEEPKAEDEQSLANPSDHFARANDVMGASRSIPIRPVCFFRIASRHIHQPKKLGLVTQPLLVPVRLHALTALMFGDLGFAAFFN